MKIIAACLVVGALFYSGCNFPRECPPQITGEDVWVTAAAVKGKQIQEDANITAQRFGVPLEWLPERDKERSWFAIIIHHSATVKGSAAYFDKEHRGRVDDTGAPWNGIGYDFVIGNGTLSGDGEVEATFRWKNQIAGAHCKTADNWANTYGVGIALVGNFEYSWPTKKQLESLKKLVAYLQKRYDIPIEDIYGHGQTPGAHATDCPGRFFPMAAFKTDLLSAATVSYNSEPNDPNR